MRDANKLPPQQITGLTISNFKRVTAVQINLDEQANTVVLAGENAAGKSSILDAIWAAVGGTRVAPNDPIRHGADKAVVIAETQDLVITRRFTPKGSTLTVTHRDGSKVTSPQGLLDSLVTSVGFDPLAFSAMAPADQAEQLLGICPTGLDLAKNAGDTQEAFDDRRVANRVAGQLRSQLAAMPKVEDAGEMVDVSGEVAKLDGLKAEQQEQAVERERVNALKQEARAANEAYDRTLADIAAAEANLFALRERSIAERTHSCERSAEFEVRHDGVSKFVDLDPSIYRLAAEIEEQAEANSHIYDQQNAAKAYETKAWELEIAAREATNQDERLCELKTARTTAIAAAQFPIDGLSISESGEVTYNDVLLSQASTAEQIRVGIAIAAAAAPGLRVCFIRNGSLLDRNSMKQVAALAAEKHMQVWIERVADDSPAALQIVDGGIAEVADTGAAKKPAAIDPRDVLYAKPEAGKENSNG